MYALSYCYISVWLYHGLLGYNSEWNRITESHKREPKGVLKVVEYTKTLTVQVRKPSTMVMLQFDSECFNCAFQCIDLSNVLEWKSLSEPHVNSPKAACPLQAISDPLNSRLSSSTAGFQPSCLSLGPEEIGLDTCYEISCNTMWPLLHP